jgi:hypothetical protein
MTASRKYTLLGADRKPYQSPTPGTLGGHRHGKVYGRVECPAELRAIARGGYVRNRVFFADEATAIAAGYRPCAACLTDIRRGNKKRGRGRDGNVDQCGAGTRRGAPHGRHPVTDGLVRNPANV